VAECRLPFSFNVVPKKLPAANGKRKRVQELPTPEPPANRRRIDGANATAQIHHHHPPPDVELQDAPEVVQPREDSTSSSPPQALPPVPSAPLDAIKPPNQPIAPPRTEGESAPTLTEVNPDTGSITGGANIWLKGIDFPTLFPLFARFGTAVVPTVSSLITFVRLFLIGCLRHSVIPIFLPVVCLLPPTQALSMLHYRNIHRQMRRSMEPASRSSTM
jgi:hypothetical protein